MTRRPCYIVSTHGNADERGGDKLTIGTVPHVVQSADSDSNAFFMVIETTVDAHSGGGVEKKTKDLISSFKHWSPTNM